jgi:class 3 adenylate cyclase
MPDSQAPRIDVLHIRLTGSKRHQFLRELSTNSAHFPIANIIYESLREGLTDYLLAPDLYAIAAAGLLQAHLLVRWQSQSWRWAVVGNLVGPATYTLLETMVEGSRFFAAPQHLAYWAFAALIGGAQGLRARFPDQSAPLLILEQLTRTAIPFVLYALFESQLDPAYATIRGFLADGSHVFIGLTLMLLGLVLGFATVLADRYLRLLRATTAELQMYSEWLFGAALLRRAVADPSALPLRREERTILFADVRGFTAWSERHDPADVLTLLNEYYRLGEIALQAHGAIRVKLAADEMMAPFPTAANAAAAALALQAAVTDLFSNAGLAIGIGVNTGPVVEGVVGGHGVRAYDVVGDTVNTAKRIEGAAHGGEVLLGEQSVAALGPLAALGPMRTVSAKGKDLPVSVYPLIRLNTDPPA